MIIVCKFSSWMFQPRKMRSQHCFKMSGTDCPVMWCVQEELNPQSDCTFLIFKFLLWCCWRFKSHGFYVVLAGKYFPVSWRIIVCTSSGSSNLKRIFIPKCSGLDIHLGVHETEEEGTVMFRLASSWHCVTPKRLYSDCNFFISCCCVPGI